MIPKFEDYFFPCLKCLSDGKIHNQASLREYTIHFFHLTEEEINAPIRSGKKTQLYDKVQWTTSYFMQAKIIETPKRGNYVITQRGEIFLQNTLMGFIKRIYVNFLNSLNLLMAKQKRRIQ